LLGFGLDRGLALDHREQVASFMNSPTQFIGFGELQLYGFFADATGHSKIAVTSHRRASSLRGGLVRRNVHYMQWDVGTLAHSALTGVV
jgi:hypothetical protein